MMRDVCTECLRGTPLHWPACSRAPEGPIVFVGHVTAIGWHRERHGPSFANVKINVEGEERVLPISAEAHDRLFSSWKKNGQPRVRVSIEVLP